MLLFESVRAIFDFITAPLLALFDMFPDYKIALEGLLGISIAYCGWRALK